MGGSLFPVGKIDQQVLLGSVDMWKEHDVWCWQAEIHGETWRFVCADEDEDTSVVWLLDK